MKKYIFTLLAAMIMVLGLAHTSFADEVKYYEGTVNVWVEDSGNQGTEAVAVLATWNNGHLEFEFNTSNGHHFKCWVSGLVEGSGNHTDNYVLIDDTFETHYGGAHFINQNTITFYSKTEYVVEGDFGFYLNVDLVLSEVPVIHEISEGFTGTAVSDRGDYNLYIAGYFRKDLADGVHTLALSDITSQTIAIVAHHNENGKNRNMNQSTIEEMTVTVSGGEVRGYEIRGRVQTDGGTLDRYTAIINP